MRTIPDAAELLEIAAAFRAGGTRHTPQGEPTFHERVAANAVAIAQREQALGNAADAAALRRLRALLPAAGGDLPELERQLAADIRDGKLDALSPGLLAHLWRSTLDELAIDQPRYATCQLVTAHLAAGAATPLAAALPPPALE